jgi:hypothetical protein
MMRAVCMLVLGALAVPRANVKPEPPPEAAPLEGVRVEAVRLVVHARAIEVVEEISVPSSALERDVFVSLPSVELPSAFEASLVDAGGAEACAGLPWRRLPQKVRTTALLHGSAHEAGVGFPLRACPALAPSARVVVRVRGAYARPEGSLVEWRRALGLASVEPSPLRRIVVARGPGVHGVARAEARLYRAGVEGDGRPTLFVEGEMESADPAAADPALVRRTGADRLLVRVWLKP